LQRSPIWPAASARRRARRGGSKDRAHPPLQRRHRAQLRRPRARFPGFCRGRSAVEWPRRDHGRARLVHRVLPAVRLRPRRLRRAVRREARAAAGSTRTDACDVVRSPSSGARRRRRVAAAAAVAAAGVGRRRRLAAIGHPRWDARATADDRHHRRAASAFRPARRALPRRRRARGTRPSDDSRGDQHARVRRRQPSAGRLGVRRLLPGDDEPLRSMELFGTKVAPLVREEIARRTPGEAVTAAAASGSEDRPAL
jgi:hypothetical protein